MAAPEVVARAARLVARAELAATVKDPLHRPYGLLGLGLVLAAAIPGILWATRADLHASTALAGTGLALAAAAVMAGYWSLAVYTATWIGARRQFRIAARTWLLDTRVGTAAAALVDVRGVLVLRCVAAHPRGLGAGGLLLHQICAEADRDGLDLTLQAVNTRAARLYRRHGFRDTARIHLPGRRPMRRPAA